MTTPCKPCFRSSPLRVTVRTALAACLFSASIGQLVGVDVESEQRTWHPMVLRFTGPVATQTDTHPNPFLGYRLQVAFTAPSGRVYDVPGFFDGDGQGGAKGNVWRVRFSPDAAGDWRYRASFRQGPGVAVALEPDAGQPAAFDGASGNFAVKPRDPAAPGFLKWGRLEYADGHYLKFRDGGYWIRGGTDCPENFLAYADFDNTPPSHHYAAHAADWRPGDPDWGNGRGRAIIGALNYLASRSVNSLYLMPMNIGGDGQDVWPFAGQPNPKGSPANDNLHYDLAKLRQWEIVFAHAQRQGIFLHFALNEAERANKRELDDGELGVERKLYYRELVARFGHHLALEWNLCEEYNLQFDLGAERVRDFAGYIAAVDPYDHPITVHPAGDPLAALRFTFGDPRFSLTSIQIGQRRIDELTEAFRRATAAAGRPLPISMDEFTLDAGQPSAALPVDDADRQRREKLWPTYLSGGMVEFILEDLLATDSFKTPQREALWEYTWHARAFMEQNLPFWEMQPADELVEGEATLAVGAGRGKTFPLGAQVFAKRGQVYAIYLPVGNPAGTLDLNGFSGRFEKRWFNPRTGQFVGEPTIVQGGAALPLGTPPPQPAEDWVVLIKSAAARSARSADFQSAGLQVSNLRSPESIPVGGTYFPTPDSEGGWRVRTDADGLREAGINKPKLDEAFAFVQTTTKNGGLLVLQNGWLVYERYFGKGHRDALCNGGSCGKSFTSIAIGILMAERPELFPDGLDQRIFTPQLFPPEAFPLSDPRKADIKLGQLLSFSAGLRGNNPGYVKGEQVTLKPIGPDGWQAMVDEIALGKRDLTYQGQPCSAATLWCEPGGGYSYATASIHLGSMMLRHVTGRELQDYVGEKLAQPLGWGRWTYAYKHAKEVTHTPGGGGIALRATDVVRFGYLLLNEGRWQERQIVPAEYVRHCRSQSPYNPHYPYSLQFNVNTRGEILELPRDAFWKTGSGGHCLYIVPSANLVVWKLGGRDSQYSSADTGLPILPHVQAAQQTRPAGEPSPERSAYAKTLRMVLEAVQAK